MKLNQTFKRVFSGLLSVAMILFAFPSIPVYAATGTTVYKYDGYEVSYSVTNEWNGGQNVSVTITNTGSDSILNWALKYDAEGSITNLYNAVIYDNSETQYVVKNNNWNFEIAPNQSVNFGYDLCEDSFSVPTEFELCSERTNISNGYEVVVNYTGTWDTGVRGEITINNTSNAPLEAWTLSFDTNFTIDNIWDGRLLDSNNNHYTIASEMWTNPIPVDGSKTIGFIGTKIVDEAPCITNYSLTSVVINAHLEHTTVPDTSYSDELDTIFAYGLYDVEENSIILDWFYKDITGDFKIYEISGEKTLIDEVTEDTTYFYEVDEESEEYTFIIEKEKADEIIVSNVVFMKKNSAGTYDFILQFDDSIINSISENSLRDIQALNENEEYPLEIQFNYNETQITSISGKYSRILIDSPEDAIYSIYGIKTLLGINEPKTELQLNNMNYSNSGVAYSFSQLYNGIKVYGSNVTVSVDNYGNAVSLSSNITESDVISTFINNIPELNSDDRNNFFQENFPELEILQSELLVYVDDERTDIQLAYLIYATENDDFQIKIINVNTGDVIEEYSTFNNEMITGTGSDEDGNPVDFPINKEVVDYYGELSDSGELMFYPHHIRYTLEDTSKKIYMYDKSNGNDKYINIEDLKSVSNPIEWTDGAAISAYRNIITTYDWWKLKFGYKGLNGKGGNVKSYVHDSQLTDNAKYYWTIFNEEIRFGDSTSGKPSKVSDLSAVGHEYTHSVVRHRTNDFFAMKKGKAGTINEAYADIFGSFINNNTWRTYPRDIANPMPKNPSSISDSSFLSDYSDEHKNSTIISHAAYLMQFDYDISFDKLYTLWYDSLAEGYSTSSDFYTVRTNVIKAARKNKFSYQEISNIKNAFDDVGVTEDMGSVKISILDGNTGVNSVKVTLINYGKTEESYTGTDGSVIFRNVEIGTNTIKIDIPGHEPIFSQILVRKDRLSEKSINLINSLNLDDISYTIYDHFNYPESYSTIKEQHILFIDSNIKMIGYSSDPLKDFIIVNNTSNTPSSYNQLQISFNIKRDSADWHTMEGGGVLFNTKISTDNLLTGYCMLVTQQGLNLYYIDGVNVDLFRDGNKGNISDVGELLETYDIGDVLDNHELSLKISEQVITLWDGDSLIIDNYILPHNTQSYDFGLLTSHISHACHQISYFTFSDIEMNIIAES